MQFKAESRFQQIRLDQEQATKDSDEESSCSFDEVQAVIEMTDQKGTTKVVNDDNDLMG